MFKLILTMSLVLSASVVSATEPEVSLSEEQVVTRTLMAHLRWLKPRLDASPNGTDCFTAGKVADGIGTLTAFNHQRRIKNPITNNQKIVALATLTRGGGGFHQFCSRSSDADSRKALVNETLAIVESL